jgi:hypothetical protein
MGSQVIGCLPLKYRIGSSYQALLAYCSIFIVHIYVTGELCAPLNYTGLLAAQVGFGTSICLLLSFIYNFLTDRHPSHIL